MKITLWVPSVDSSARWPCIQSWWNLETPDNIKLRLYRSGANNPIFSWNEAVRIFLDDTTDDWLLSWHSDVVGDPQTLMRLLSWEKPLVSALVFMRTSPVTPHLWEHHDNDGGQKYAQIIKDTRRWVYAHPEHIKEFGPFVMNPRPDDALAGPIAFTSTSCMLMHRDALEGMRKSVNDIWFKWDDDIRGGGEDRFFCENARAAGFPAYVDRSCIVGHLAGDIPTGLADFIMWDYCSSIMNTGEPPDKQITHEVIR
jgi:GT2 family glycosyltransferase